MKNNHTAPSELNKPKPNLLLFGIMCALLALPPAVIEIGLKIPLTERFYSEYAGTLSILLVPYLVARFSRAALLVYLGFLAALATLYAVPWNARKPFLIAASRLKKGMTVEQVEAKMKAYPQEALMRNGQTVRANELPDLMVFYQPPEAQPYKDRVKLRFYEGKVDSMQIIRD